MPENINVLVPITYVYKNRVGQFIESYIKGLSQKKILGVKCPKCKKVYVPPRSVCGKCFSHLDKLVEVSQEGILENFTVGHVTIDNGELKDAPPYILGVIKLKKADSTITAIVKGVEPKDAKSGLAVRAVWKEPPEDNLSSLDHFEIIRPSAKKRGR